MELQETRRYILEILKEEACTVDEIVQGLSERIDRRITTVTVRHHLERLRAEGLVNPPEIRRRNTPGRPQYVYSLSDKAFEYFPNNYVGLAEGLLKQIKQHLPQNQVNVILEDMADNMAESAGIMPDVPIKKRLKNAVAYLNEQGYSAEWEETDEGFLLSTTNCPYERIAGDHEELCQFDTHLMTSLLGVVPRLTERLREGDNRCLYFIPHPSKSPSKSL